MALPENDNPFEPNNTDLHDNLPMTDEALLFKIQELHVEAVKRIRDQPWEFKRMINVTVKVLYAIAKDLYEHYMTLKQ